MGKRKNKEKEEENTRKPPIALWNANEHRKLINFDGKLFICNFNKVINQPSSDLFKKFYMGKISYEKQLYQITNYINYFIEMYDKENELITSYMHLKYMIDKDPQFVITPDMSEDEKEKIIDGFIEFVHQELFAEDNHIKENIIKLVNDNYLDDVEKKTGKKNNEKEYLESLEFTNEHVKLMLMISFAMKIICPVMFHYLYFNKIEVKKDSNYIFRFYKPLFDKLFTDDVNIYNKIFTYVKSRVKESESINSPIFDKRSIFGSDPFVVVNNFTRRVLISENMVKFSFPENWDAKNGKYMENIPGFTKTIIKYQLNYYLKEVYEKNLTEVSNIKNSEGLSGQDKMEMNIKKVDEGKALYAKLNAVCTIDTIRNIFDIPVEPGEVKYMQDNWHPDRLQIKLIYTFFARYFGNYRDTNLVSRYNFFYLALLLKKKLLVESGWDTTDTGIMSYVALPYILTGNLEGKMNSRVIRNNKYMSKIDEEIHYRQLCEDEYSVLLEIHPEEIKTIISTFINSRFTYVTPEDPDLTGSEIAHSEDKIGSETIFFLFN